MKRLKEKRVGRGGDEVKVVRLTSRYHTHSRDDKLSKRGKEKKSTWMLGLSNKKEVGREERIRNVNNT